MKIFDLTSLLPASAGIDVYAAVAISIAAGVVTALRRFARRFDVEFRLEGASKAGREGGSLTVSVMRRHQRRRSQV